MCFAREARRKGIVTEQLSLLDYRNLKFIVLANTTESNDRTKNNYDVVSVVLGFARKEWIV